MKNPMLAKNPFMSAWLSAANTTGGAAKGNMMAEMQRQQVQAMQDWQKMWMQMWFPWMKQGK